MNSDLRAATTSSNALKSKLASLQRELNNEKSNLEKNDMDKDQAQVKYIYINIVHIIYLNIIIIIEIC